MEKKQSKINMPAVEDLDHHHSSDDDLGSNLLKAIVSNLPKKSRSKFNCSSRSGKMLASDDASRRALLANTTGIFYKISETKYVYFDKSRRVESSTNLYQPNYNFIPSSSQNHRLTPNLSFEFLPCYPNFKINCSCNGLLICSSHQDYHIYVCNPLMKRWVSIPNLEGSNYEEFIVYDPKISPHHFIIFGHLKLPKLPSNPTEVSVFSSSKGTWGKFELTLEGSTLPSWNRRYWAANLRAATYAYYLNGTVYALVYPDILIAIPL